MYLKLFASEELINRGFGNNNDSPFHLYSILIPDQGVMLVYNCDNKNTITTTNMIEGAAIKEYFLGDKLIGRLLYDTSLSYNSGKVLKENLVLG